MRQLFVAPRRVCWALAALLASPAGILQPRDARAADPVADREDPFQFDPLQVTGTRVRVKGAEPVVPVVTFTGEELKRRGYTNLGDFSRNLNFNAGAVDEFTTFDGAARFNLRGLGTDATLTLVNGRRHSVANLGGASALDLNAIPMALIDRIEVLKDGASAIYGADAVAGVVNIILKKDFLGGELDFSYRNTTDTDLSETQGSISYGRFFGAGSVWGFLSHYRANALAFRDREAFRTDDLRALGGPDSRFPFSRPGNYLILGPGGIGFDRDPACDAAPHPSGVAATVPLPPFIEVLSDTMCAYDERHDLILLRASERSNLYAGFDFPLGEQSLFGEVFVNQRSTETELPPTLLDDVANGFFGLPLAPPDHPSNPFGAPVALLYRLTDVGKRGGFNDWDFYRVLLGLRGGLGRWDYEAAIHYSQDRLDRRFTNRILSDAFQAALEGRGGPSGDAYYDPFGGPNDPAVLAAFTVRPRWIHSNDLLVVDAFAGRDLFEWRHGIAGFAAGFEYRTQDDATVVDEFTAAGRLEDLIGITAEAFDRDVASVFAEVTLPVYRDFDVQLAARHEQFSDFGGATSPKLGVRWKVNDHLVVRGSLSEAFKAPDFFELAAAPEFFQIFYIDPVRCADPALAATLECTAGLLIGATQSGNRDLDPESASSTVLGLVFVPPFAPRLAIDLDYWRFDYEDRIELLSSRLLREFFPDDQRFVIRAAPSPEDVAAGRPGPVTELLLPFINFEVLQTEGYDAAVSWDRSFRRLGRLELQARASYFERYEFTDALIARPGNRVGSSVPFPLPRWRANLTATWDKNQDSVTLNLQRVGAFRDESNPARPEFEYDPWWSVELQYRRMFPRWNFAQLSAGCLNCLDNAAPRDPFYYGALEGVFDPRGRQLSAGLTWRF